MTICTDLLAHSAAQDSFQKQDMGTLVLGEPLFLLPLNEDTRTICRGDEFALDGDSYSIYQVNFDRCDPVADMASSRCIAAERQAKAHD